MWRISDMWRILHFLLYFPAILHNRGVLLLFLFKTWLPQHSQIIEVPLCRSGYKKTVCVFYTGRLKIRLDMNINPHSILEIMMGSVQLEPPISISHSASGASVWVFTPTSARGPVLGVRPSSRHSLSEANFTKIRSQF